MKSKYRGLIPPLPKRRPAVLASSIAALAVLCLAPRPALAQTWLANPVSGDWNTGANWSGGTAPTGIGATATFGFSNTTAISLSATFEISAINFTSSATSPYTLLIGNHLVLGVDNGTITNNSSVTQNILAENGSTFLLDTATSTGNITYTANGSNGVGGSGTLNFSDATVSSATIITNGGTNGGSGGTTDFAGSDGTTSRAITNAGGTFDLGGFSSKIGSIEGAGTYILRSGTLTVGSNNLSTTVSGVIENGGSGGSLTKVGTGTLTLTGQNTYTGQTTINGGTLQLGTLGFAGSLAAASAISVNPVGTLAVVNTGGTFANSLTNAGGSSSGGQTLFSGLATAGTATISNQGATAASVSAEGQTTFTGNSNAGGALINNDGGTVTNAFGGSTVFNGNASAGNATLTNLIGAVSGASAGSISFDGNSTAGHASITNQTGSASGRAGATTTFSDFSTAGSATIAVNGGTGNGAGGATLFFLNNSSAGSATLQINGGSGGGTNGTVYFRDTADGGTANVVSTRLGILDISGLSSSGMKIGSIQGSGTIFLGGKTLTVGGNGTASNISGVIADGGLFGGSGGSLVVSGPSPMTLTGQNTYTGHTSLINGATLNANVAGALPAPAADGGNGTARDSLTVDLTGAGGSTLNLGANQAVAFLIGLTSTSTINLNGHALTVGNTNANLSIFAGLIADGTGSAGSGGLIVDGDHTLQLTGNDTYTGPTILNGTSTLQVGNGTTGNLTGGASITVNLGANLVTNLANGATFTKNVNVNGSAGNISANFSANSSGTNTLSGVISGTGNFDQSGTGTTILTGLNTFTGGTFVNTGTLQIGNATTGGSIGASSAVFLTSGAMLSLVNVAGGNFGVGVDVAGVGTATLNINTATSFTLSGALTNSSGTLSLIKNGAGKVIINGNGNSSTGTTTVNAGILEVDGNLGNGTVTVNKGGTLSGGGNIGGSVNILSGGTLQPLGQSAIIDGSLVLNTGANTNIRLASPTTSDMETVGGNLTLAGNLNLTPIVGFGVGTFELFGYGGTLTNHGFTITGLPGYTTTINTTLNPGQVDLIVALAGALPTFLWDGATTVGNGTISGGSGAWNTSTTNWTDFSATTNSAWKSGTAVFAATGGTVTLGSAVSAQGLTFASNHYIINGTTTLKLTLTGSAPIVSVQNSSDTATINAPITSTGGLIANGLGTLVLGSTANAISGKVAIATGTVQLGNAGGGGSFGASSTVALSDGGTLLVMGVLNNVLPNAISTSLGQGGTVNIASTGNVSLSGALTEGTPGQLALTQSGSGTTFLTNAGNKYSGQTTISAGTLQIGTPTAAGSLGAGSTVSVGMGGALSLVNVSGGVLVDTVVNNVGGAGQVSINATGNLTLSGGMTDGTGSLALTKNATGTTILTGASAYSGATTVNTGTLQIGDGTTLGTTIAASGAVQVNNTAILAINLPTGATFANGVALNGAGSALNTVQTGINTLSGAITGNGGLNQKGAGTTILTGSSGFSGPITVSAGTLQFGNGGSKGFPGITNFITVSGTGTLALDMGLLFATTQPIVLSTKTSTLQAIQPAETDLSGVISGLGTLVQNGSGITDLTGAIEAYTGGTTVKAGLLRVGELAKGTVTVSGGTFEVDSALDAGSVVNVGTAGTLSGSGNINGNVTLTGNGTIHFAGASINGTLGVTGGNWTGGGNVTGLTTSSSGVFTIGSGGILAAMGGLNVTGGTLAGPGTLAGSLNYTSVSSTFGGVISGATSTVTLNKPGTTLILTGVNTYGGATTVSAGTLQVGDGSTPGSSLGTSAVTVSGTSTLAVNLPDGSAFNSNVALSATGASFQSLPAAGTTTTVTGVISGPGVFNQNGAGTTVLTGAETSNGVTNVKTGTLEVDGTLAAASTVNVTTAGTLTGNGTINGKTTVTGSGIIALGSTGQIGTLGATGGSWLDQGTASGLVTASGTGNTFTIGAGANLTASAGVAVTSGTLGGTGTLTGSLNYTSPTSSTFAGIIAGATSTLTLNNAATTLTVTGASTFGGGTTVSAGTLQVGDGSTVNTTLGTGAVTVSGTGSLALTLPLASTFSNNVNLSTTGATFKSLQTNSVVFVTGVISGQGVFNQNGIGSVTDLTNTETYTGLTNVNAGSLDVSGSLAAGSTVNVEPAGRLVGFGTIHGNVTLNGASSLIALEVSGSIGGTLVVKGGTWGGSGTVDGLVTATGLATNVFTIAAGANLTAVTGVALIGGTLAGPGTLTGPLDYTSPTSSTFGGVVTGATSDVIVNTFSPATLVLTGANNYGGTTMVSAGTLQLGDGVTPNSSLGAGALTVSGTGTLALNLPDLSTFSRNVNLNATGAAFNAVQSGALTFTGVLSGVGKFNQNGTGVTVITTSENYSGATAVNAGILEVDGSLAAASTVTVGATGTLRGTGMINGSVNVNAGGTIVPGDGSIGTLTTGNLVLNSGANFGFLLNTPNSFGGTANSLVQVHGNLTLAGTLNVFPTANFGVGQYELFNYTGSLTNKGVTAINGTGGFITSILAIGGTGTVELVVTSAVTGPQFWDGNGAQNDSHVTGGSGTWNNSTSNWTNFNDSVGASNMPWQGGTAEFGGTGGTVILGAPINVQGITFDSGYIISGTSFALNLVGSPSTRPQINVAGGNIGTISAPLTGIAGLNVPGNGLLILANAANTYTGTTAITNGTLQIGTTSAAGSLSPGFVQVGQSGKLILVNIHNNVLTSDVTNGLGGTANLAGQLQIASASTITLSGALTDGSSGTLNLSQNGSATILTNTGNTFSGGTEVDAGVLQIGTATVDGSIGSGSILIGGADLVVANVVGNTLTNNISGGFFGTPLLRFISPNTITVSGNLTDGIVPKLAVTQSGTGTTILTGNNTSTAATTISAGTLQIGNGTTGSISGSTAITVSGTGSLALDLATASTFANPVLLSAPGATLKAVQPANDLFTITGLISGSGGFTQSGAGQTSLSTTNETYTGPTNVNAGILAVNGSLAAGSTVNVATAGTLGGTGTIKGNATLTGNGIINFSGGQILGTLAVTGGKWNGTGTVAGVVTASGAATNTFTIGSSATLTAPKGLALTGGGLAGTGKLAGSLTDTSSTNTGFDGVISGTGSKVTMNNKAATLVLASQNTYGGGTIVTAGTLQVGDGSTGSSSLGTAPVTIAGAGTLTIDLADGGIFDNNVTEAGHLVATGTTNNYLISSVINGGGGTFTKTGTNIVNLNEANGYTGGTTVNGGNLLVTNTTGSATGTGAVTINSGALGGAGRITGAMTLNNGAAIFPGDVNIGTPGSTLHGSALTWNPGGKLTFQLGGTVSDALALSGKLTKGAKGTGAFTINILDDGGITAGLFTLATFTSTTFLQTDFTLDLPGNYTGELIENATSLQLEIDSGSGEQPAHSEGTTDLLASDNAPTPGTDFGPSSLSVTPTPEPTSAALLAFGGAALLAYRRRHAT